MRGHGVAVARADLALERAWRGDVVTPQSGNARTLIAKAIGGTAERSDAYSRIPHPDFHDGLMLHPRRVRSHAAARMALFEWAAVQFNPHRRHWGLGRRSLLDANRAAAAAAGMAGSDITGLPVPSLPLSEDVKPPFLDTVCQLRSAR